MKITKKTNKKGIVVTGKNFKKMVTELHQKLDESSKVQPFGGQIIWCPTPFGAIHVTNGKLDWGSEKGFEWFKQIIS